MPIPESSVPTPAKRDRRPHELRPLSARSQLQGRKSREKERPSGCGEVLPRRCEGSTRSQRRISKACKQYEALGDWQDALDFCRGALSREGVKLEDYQNFVRLQLAKTGLLVPAEIEDVVGVVKHLSADESTGAAAAEMQCDLGVRISSVQHLQECTTKLAALAPNDAKVLRLPVGARDETRRLRGGEARDRPCQGSFDEARERPANGASDDHGIGVLASLSRADGLSFFPLALVAAAGAMFAMMRRRSTVSA